MQMESKNSHRHAVHFYEDSSSLCRRVADFLAVGLSSGDPAVVIATAEHQDQILTKLEERRINVNQVRRVGELVLLDAEDTLGSFMLDGNPNAALFDEHMGRILGQLMRTRPRGVIRAYGEMVDVLWKAGCSDAAIKLEARWNSLGSKYPFSLLCGYAIGRFYKQPEFFQRICDQHDAVLDIDDYVT